MEVIMRVTVINKEKKGSPFFRTFLLLLLGIILTFQSTSFVTFLFTMLGVVILSFGFSKLWKYFSLKKQNVYSNEILSSSILWNLLGLLIILLSSFFANAIQVVTGIWLIFLAGAKLNSALILKSYKHKFFTECISSFLLFLLGIYTLFAQNVVFIFLGIVLILYAIFDFIKLFSQK